ncbi:hypothetical protein LTR60_004593, partial [Cryomyces antarcticus]
MSVFMLPTRFLGALYLQFILVLIFFALLCYDGTYRGWWTDINAALALGSIAFVFTVVLSGFEIANHKSAWIRNSKLVKFSLIVLYVLVALVWVATVVLYCRHKGKDFRKQFDRPPIASWIVATVVAVLEAVLFFFTAVTAAMDFKRAGRMQELP